MTDVFQLILGAYVLTLILLPPTYSCENTKTTDVIADYNNIIHPFLLYIESLIAKDLQNKTCPTHRSVEMCEENNERTSILKMASSITFKKPQGKSQIKCELRKFVSLIDISLECNIKSVGSQEECSLLRPRSLGRRTLCAISQVLNEIRSCYSRLAEKNA